MRITNLLGVAVVGLSFLVSGLVAAQHRAAEPPEFKKSAQVFETRATVGVALEDLDADGDLDAVISNLGPSMVLMNDGKGRFNESWRAETVHGLVAGDIDRDGDADLVVAPWDQEPGRVYLNSGGRFGASESRLGAGVEWFPDCLRLVDVDHDGDLDAATYTMDGRSVVWTNDGKGRFARGAHSIPPDATFCDLNGDGFPDVVSRESRLAATPQGWVPRDGERGFRVYLNDRRGGFTRFAFLPMPDLMRGQHLWTWFGDIDSDGDSDVLYTDRGDGPVAAGVLRNDGTGRLSEGQKLGLVTMGKICTGDLNNDRALDLVVTDWGRPAELWMNDGKGTFFDGGRVGDRFNSQGCVVKDVDNDGDQDLFISDYQRGNTSIWFNQWVESRKAPKR